MEIAALFHNVRSAYNVGSLLRTADCAGVERVYLTGYTPAPFDRFGRAREDVAKVALGAERSVEWRYAKSPQPIIRALKKAGWSIVGVEQDARALDYRAWQPSRPTLFIFGNEVRGVSKALCTRCDVLLEIPIYGKKESLNVSVAAGVILFRFSI